jgi:pantetheine-phosphate adenylyltransferase
MKKCVFAGTFDPITSGHAYVIDKCLECFDKVVIAVGRNVDKNPLFSFEQRVEMLKAEYDGNPAVSIKSFDGLLTDFMKENDIFINVRGIRDQDDYKYETNMARYNADMYPQITTLYIPTPSTLLHVSSSGVRNLIALNASFKAYMPPKAFALANEFIKEKAKKK